MNKLVSWTLLSSILVLTLAGCAAPMTPQQQEARALRDYCAPDPFRDQARCYMFIGGP